MALHAAAAGTSGGCASAALAGAGLLRPLLLAACCRHALAEPPRVGHAPALGRARLIADLRDCGSGGGEISSHMSRRLASQQPGVCSALYGVSRCRRACNGTLPEQEGEGPPADADCRQ